MSLSAYLVVFCFGFAWFYYLPIQLFFVVPVDPIQFFSHCLCEKFCVEFIDLNLAGYYLNTIIVCSKHIHRYISLKQMKMQIYVENNTIVMLTSTGYCYVPRILFKKKGWSSLLAWASQNALWCTKHNDLQINERNTMIITFYLMISRFIFYSKAQDLVLLFLLAHSLFLSSLCIE